MIGDLTEARLLLIRAEIHLEWMCKESRAARELVADIQKFLTLSDSFKDSCGTVEGHGMLALGCMTVIPDGQAPSGYQSGIETASENEDAGAGAEASSAPDSKGVMPTDTRHSSSESAKLADPETYGSANHIPSEQNGAVTDPGFLIARTPFAAREDRNKPPSPPESGLSISQDAQCETGAGYLTHGIQVMSAHKSSAPVISICNPERPSIVKARKAHE